MADGGEGTLDAILAAIGDAAHRNAIEVRGANGAKVTAAYGLVPHPNGTELVVFNKNGVATAVPKMPRTFAPLDDSRLAWLPSQ